MWGGGHVYNLGHLCQLGCRHIWVSTDLCVSYSFSPSHLLLYLNLISSLCVALRRRLWRQGHHVLKWWEISFGYSWSNSGTGFCLVIFEEVVFLSPIYLAIEVKYLSIFSTKLCIEEPFSWKEMRDVVSNVVCDLYCEL